SSRPDMIGRRCSRRTATPWSAERIEQPKKARKGAGGARRDGKILLLILALLAPLRSILGLFRGVSTRSVLSSLDAELLRDADPHVCL
ncbi:MAG: hypothetical protein ABI134_19235, partial [Byssovorax sp.]